MGAKNKKLSSLSKFIFKLLDEKPRRSIYFYNKAKIIYPSVLFCNVYATLSKFVETKNAIVEKRYGNFCYKLATLYGDNKNKMKSKPPRRVPKYLVLFLCDNIGKTFTNKNVAQELKLKQESNTSGDMRTLCLAGCLTSEHKSPIRYKVLATIKQYVIKTNTIEKVKSNNTVETISPLDTMYGAVTPKEIPELIPASNKIIDVNVNDSINFILQLQQQNTMYKTALEHIASILAQAEIIDDQ